MAEQLPRGLLADPAVQRAMLLPVARRTYTDPGDDITEEQALELAMPGLLYDPMLGMAQTGAMLMGDMPADPNVMTQTMLDAPLVGGLLSAATGAVPRGALLGANVFHGGPHRFAAEPDFPHGRPRLDKIGTGEGNQAYGYGFYSAEAPGVAEAYKTALAKGGEVVSDGQRFPVSPAGGRGEKDELLQRLQKEMRLFLTDNITNAGPKKLEADWQEYADETLDMQLSNMRASPETVEWANKNLRGKHTWIADAGTLYKLDIPDADVAKYLDYDKPLSEQPKSVREALKKIGIKPRYQIVGNDGNYLVSKSYMTRQMAELDAKKVGGRVQEQQDSMLGSAIYKQLAATRGDQAASEALRKAGIPGLKYFDQDSRTRTARATIDGVSINKYKPQNGYEEYIISKFKSGVPFHEIKEIAAMRPEGDALLAKWELKVPEGTRNYVTWDQDVLNRSKMLERDGVTLGANKGPTAALPGLLDDTASRMQRARDMGFDVDAYHGTRGDFTQFEKGDLGFHFGSPEQATNRLRQTEKVFGSEGANIIPAKINVNKSLELPDLGQWNDPAVVAAGIIERGGAFGRKYGDELQEIQQEADNLKRQFEDGDAWVESMEAENLLDEIQGIIKRDGYDSVKYLNEMENKMGDRGGFTIEGQKKYNALNKEFHELTKKIAQRDTPAPELGASETEISRWLNRKPTEPTAAESKRLEEIARAKEEVEKTGTHSPYSYIVFDPKNIRSRFAKFDPAKADSADLLAANPATAALPGLLQDRRRKPGRTSRNQNSFPMRSLLGQRVYTATMPDGSI